MSHKLISHNLDLRQLRDNGYEVAIRNNHLIVTNIPYVNSGKEISYGTLVSTLTLSGYSTTKPDNHVIYFTGEEPCHSDGSLIKQIRHSANKMVLADSLVINYSFSNKPTGGFQNYFDKITSYVMILENEAKAIDASVSAQTYRVAISDDEDTIFNYPDTNSSRSKIINITNKLKGQKIGIIGLGGTGSYVLDFVAKTPVDEIHLFDGDKFLSHNAFRAPGAPTINDLNSSTLKVDYFQQKYSNMHKNIVAHTGYINSSKLRELSGLDFVFICIDNGESKFEIMKFIEGENIAFTDVGMGLEIVDDSIIGILRTTTSTKQSREHIYSNNRISFGGGGDDVYSHNIQIAELNALNASMAVIKWKKTLDFYQDMTQEHHTTYSINDNTLNNEDEA